MCAKELLPSLPAIALIAQGADIKLLQSIAGHSQASMTLDTYGHLMHERISEAADLYDPLRKAAR
ncbi:MAG: hypothetical protein H0W90_06560 [Actinobacteria bacterium]|nr:hypothetical protein [Actinomycetota bacterium]